MLSTPLICCSIGEATESASVFASAPGYVADTVTGAGVMFGYCWTGSTIMATAPASAMMIATTAAKIGRSMKKRENMKRRPLLREADVDAPCLLCAASAGDAARRDEAHALRLDAVADQRVAHCRRAPLRELDVGSAVAARV